MTNYNLNFLITPFGRAGANLRRRKEIIGAAYVKFTGKESVAICIHEFPLTRSDKDSVATCIHEFFLSRRDKGPVAKNGV